MPAAETAAIRRSVIKAMNLSIARRLESGLHELRGDEMVISEISVMTRWLSAQQINALMYNQSPDQKGLSS